MRLRAWTVGFVGMVIGCLGVAPALMFAQDTTHAQAIDIPANATALEGIPTVRIDAAEAGTTRRLLDAAEAAREHLLISVVDGQYYWTTRENRRLRLNTSGDFTYLSAEPGKYIRLTRLNDKLSYVEHVDIGAESITWWGELKILIGK